MTGVPAPTGELADLTRAIVGCRACPRLVDWREQVAQERVARYSEQVYWGRPVPGFGDPAARMLIVGLAPAAHGANRTGRMFTGDRSGDFLFASLHRIGLANQPTSTSLDDGLLLDGVYLAAVNRCAPPANKPTLEERDRCLPFLRHELVLLTEVYDHRLSRRLGLGRRRAGARARRGAATTAPTVRARRERDHRPISTAGLLSPKPAEHLHGAPHAAHDRLRLPAGVVRPD